MRIVVEADNGDEVSICADFVSLEQAIVTLEIENALYSETSEFDSITLTIDRARDLAAALLSVAEAIEAASGPPIPASLPKQTAGLGAVMAL